jgi:uncharacterized membrane protein
MKRFINKRFIYIYGNFVLMKQSQQFRIIFSIILLISSIIVLAVILLNSQPIQIVLETGQAITTQNSNYFPLSRVLLLVTASFFVGATSIYLYYTSGQNEVFSALRPKKSEAKDNYDVIAPFLKSDEKKAVLSLRESGGEILQNKLVLELGLSKVKTARLLSSLESKNIIKKERHGLTNRIILK